MSYNKLKIEAVVTPPPIFAINLKHVKKTTLHSPPPLPPTDFEDYRDFFAHQYLG